MTRGARKILFFVFFLIFLLGAPLMILYYQGYRFDFEKKSLTQTGGLFLKVIPKQAEIYLNGKLVKKTDFFFGSALIENLLPKKYLVEVKKNGYFSWKKDLEIKEREVTEAKNIVLFPKNPNFSILTKDTPSGYPNFWFSPDGKKMILKEDQEGTWALKLYDLDRSVKSHLIAGTDLSRQESELFDLKFSEDSKEIYLDVGIKEQEKKFALKLDKVPPILSEMEITPAPENILAPQTFNGSLYYLDNFGHLFKSPSGAKGGNERKFIDYPSVAKGGDERMFIDYEEKLTEKPFPVKAETEYKLSIFPEYIFLQEGETLYLFNPDSKLFEKFFEKINRLKISPDNKKLLFFSDSEIWVLFLKEKLTRPSKKAGEKILLVRLSEKIESAFWLNSDYLIFNAGDKIKIAEIDERDKLNIVDLVEFPPTTFEKERTFDRDKLQSGGGPEIFFNQTDKKLYVLADGILYSSEILPPTTLY